MNIIIATPPNYDAIDAAFQVRQRHGVLFAWGDLIYNPDNIRVTPYLMAHEEIHEKQHADLTPEVWWERYIAEPDFRLEQELPAHVMEYRAYCRRHTDQAARMRMLRELAKRLSGPLYAGLLTETRAFNAILEGRLP